MRAPRGTRRRRHRRHGRHVVAEEARAHARVPGRLLDARAGRRRRRACCACSRASRRSSRPTSSSRWPAWRPRSSRSSAGLVGTAAHRRADLPRLRRRASAASPRFFPPSTPAPTESRRSTSTPATPPRWRRTAFFPEDLSRWDRKSPARAKRPRVHPRSRGRRRPPPQEGAPRQADDAGKGRARDDGLAAARLLPRGLLPGARARQVRRGLRGDAARPAAPDDLPRPGRFAHRRRHAAGHRGPDREEHGGRRRLDGRDHLAGLLPGPRRPPLPRRRRRRRQGAARSLHRPALRHVHRRGEVLGDGPGRLAFRRHARSAAASPRARSWRCSREKARRRQGLDPRRLRAKRRAALRAGLERLLDRHRPDRALPPLPARTGRSPSRSPRSATTTS